MLLHRKHQSLRHAVAMLLPAPAVQDLKEEVQFLIASNGKPLKVAAGHNICRQGDSADCIWLLHEGAAICFAAHRFVVTSRTAESCVMPCRHLGNHHHIPGRHMEIRAGHLGLYATFRYVGMLALQQGACKLLVILHALLRLLC